MPQSFNFIFSFPHVAAHMFASLFLSFTELAQKTHSEAHRTRPPFSNLRTLILEGEEEMVPLSHDD